MGFGSQKITEGYEYFGWFADAVACSYEVDSGVPLVRRIDRIRNGDTVIWEGPVDYTAADGDGKVTLETDIGTAFFYFGMVSQSVDPILATLTVDRGAGPVAAPMSAWPRIAYCVWEDASFGNQVVPPTLIYEGLAVPGLLASGTETVAGEANPVDVVYEILRDAFTFLGLPGADLITSSFVTASAAVSAAGLGFSPILDENESAREIIGRLNSYVDAFLVQRGGGIEFKLLQNESTAGAGTISEPDLLEIPELTPGSLEETWGVTVITFRDVDNADEETSETFFNDANIALRGRAVRREFNFPFVSSREVAKKLARRIGQRSGVPVNQWKLTLNWNHRGLLPGDVILFSHAKEAVVSLPLRVQSVRVGGTGDRRVEIEAHEELRRDDALDYVPPPDDFTIATKTDGGGAIALASTTPRLAWLPAGLRVGANDGVLICCHRPNTATVGLYTYWTFNPGVQGYQNIDHRSTFPAKGRMVAWHKIGEGTSDEAWSIRVTMDTADDLARLEQLLDEEDNTYLVSCLREYASVSATKDQHQVIVNLARMVSAGRYSIVNPATRMVDLEMQGGHFASQDFAFETDSAEGFYPCEHVYFGRVTSLALGGGGNDMVPLSYPGLRFNSDSAYGRFDNGKERLYKCLTAIPGQVESLNAVTASEYDRDDTTMCPEGTLSNEWGSRVPSTYEIVDEEGGAIALNESAADYGLIEDVDEALGAILDESSTADEDLLAGNIDDMLGAMAQSGQTWYQH